jgi:hypothetical protein
MQVPAGSLLKPPWSTTPRILWPYFFIMSKTEPNDWNLALEKAQEALRVYENLIINSSAPAGGSKPLFQDELVTWIGSLLYRLGRYETTTRAWRNLFRKSCCGRKTSGRVYGSGKTFL